MKKVTALILCALLLLTMASSTLAATTKTIQTAPLKVRQYGEEDQLVSDKDGIAATICYPLGDVEEIDTALTTWASLTLEEFRKEAAAAAADAGGIKGTLDVDYESHEHDGRFVGIEEFGTYRINGKTETGSVLYTYNYDLLSSKPLALFEVVNEDHMDKIIGLVEKGIAEQAVTLTNVNGPLAKDDMRQFVIRSDGIGWLFTGETGIVGVLLSYETLKPYLCLESNVPAPASATTPAPGAAVEIEQTAVCMHNGSHIRSEPDQHSDLIDTVNANTELEIVKSNVVPGWHEILYNGQIAYISAPLVQLSSQKTQTVKGFVTSDILHVREGAGTKYRKLGTLQYQEQVDILQEYYRPHWHRILYKGQVAYAYADDIAIGNKPVNTPDPAAAATPVPEEVSPRLVSFGSVNWSEVGTCTTNGVIVRSRESIRSDYYGKLRAGMQVYIIEYGEHWCKIYVPQSHNNGYVGYAHTKYFDIATPEVAPAQQANPKTIISIA